MSFLHLFILATPDGLRGGLTCPAGALMNQESPLKRFLQHPYVVGSLLASRRYPVGSIRGVEFTGSSVICSESMKANEQRVPLP